MMLDPQPQSNNWRHQLLRYGQVVGMYWAAGLLCTSITYGLTWSIVRLLIGPPTGGPNMGGVIAFFMAAPIGSSVGWVSSRWIVRVIRGTPHETGCGRIGLSGFFGVLTTPIYLIAVVIEQSMVALDTPWLLGLCIFGVVSASLLSLLMVLADWFWHLLV